MTSEDYADGYQAGYQNAYNQTLEGIQQKLLQHICQVPPFKSGYSVYDGGYEDGVQQAKKLIDKFFNSLQGR